MAWTCVGAGVESLTTYSGAKIGPYQKGLPKTTRSVCPECLEIIDARLFAEAGKVMMEKTCPSHGTYRDVYWGDVDLFLRSEEWLFEGRGLSNPNVDAEGDCSTLCGLCRMHTSHTGLGNIDLTNRCNLTCPICFANANVTRHVYEPTMEEVVTMLRAYRETRPVAGRTIQFSGGEPTIYPRFFDAVRAARAMGFSHIQIASNGIALNDLDFCKRAEEAGLHTIYLQFDGVSDDIYMKIRGQPLLGNKLKAIENVAKTTMKIALVPTVVRGVNDHQLGDMVRFAVENVHVVAGISFQPVCFTGRISHEERMERRITLPDVANAMIEQTGFLRKEDFFPLSCGSVFGRLLSALRGEETLQFTCHPHCTLCTYLVVDGEGRPTPMSRFIDVPAFFRDIDALAAKARKSRFKLLRKIQGLYSLRRRYDESRAPEGFTFMKFLHTLNGMVDKKVGRGEGEKKTFKTLLIGGMHFMDAYNYDLERLRRCVIHFSTPEGKLYPFCSYNSVRAYRNYIEKKYSVPLGEWKKANGYLKKAGVME